MSGWLPFVFFNRVAAAHIGSLHRGRRGYGRVASPYGSKRCSVVVIISLAIELPSC